ncbi:MAG TPA: ferritin-like domain-containing protein [Myxococcota bacterium]|nr:ferritin-like domain-containing protein [Myxococcota bacterium]
MEKLMQEHRKRFGEFEVIEFVDESEIERLRAQINVPVPLTLNWQWNYGSEVAELRQLYEKGKVHQWNAETDLDWSIPVTNDDWVVTAEASMMAQILKLMGKDEATQKAAAFDELAHTLSQLLHGEQAALQLCGQLTNACPKMDEKWYAASQVADEARHIEVISKFLQRKVGMIYPINPTLKILLDRLLEAETPQKKTLGMQTLFEGMAVGIMDLMRTESRNPLLTEMLRRVEQDESRHAAFGVLSMRRVVRQADKEELAEMEDWAFGILEALNANQQLDMLQILGPKYGVDPESVVKMAIGMPNFAEFNSLAYMHTVIPNLVRLGLLTERTERQYRTLGMMVSSRGEAPQGLPLVAN